MADLVVALEFHLLDIETGAWCGSCLLPSVVSVPWVAVSPDTLRTVLRGTMHLCQDCGQERNEPGARRRRP